VTSVTQEMNTMSQKFPTRTKRDSFATDQARVTIGNPCSSDRSETVTDLRRLNQIRELEMALQARNTELKRVRDERDRYKAALLAIIDNKRDEPFAGDFANDVLRGMTADEYARQIRIGHAEVARKLYEGQG